MNEQRLTVLVVDDTPENIDLLTGILRDHYKMSNFQIAFYELFFYVGVITTIYYALCE